ncbi:MAG TPA: hypothetical protein VGC76_19645 [Pyrinomonadaceae bacterium]|jgi:hypothetical protein
MIKTLLFAAVLTFVVLLNAAPDASAQTKKRITFKKGFAVVSGTIKGDETLEYVFRVKKNADVDISVENDRFTHTIYPKFVLLKPDGNVFYGKDSVNYGLGTDMMDVLPQAGDYTIQLQLPEDMRNEGKPVSFRFQIIVR